MVRFNFCSKTNITELNALVFLFCLVPRPVIGTQKSHLIVMKLISHYAAYWEENIPPCLPPCQAKVRVIIMSRSLPQPPLRSPRTQKKNRRMRLPVWRFGWGRNTVHERYGTVLHRTSTCGDDCWIEHGIQACPTLCAVNIFYCACIKINFVCILKPDRSALIYGRKFWCQRNIKRQLRHNS